MSQIKTFGSHLVNFECIPDNGVFIDAGACQGNFIKDIQANIKSPRIFAIEPNKTNILNFMNMFSGISGIHLIKGALVGSGEPRTMRFADFTRVGLPEWGNVSGLYENRNPDYYDVETIRIRTLLECLPSGPIHHLKMDIEGCEDGVITDLTIADAKRIQQISLEVHGKPEDMLRHLEAIGYDAKFANGELYAVQRGGLK